MGAGHFSKSGRYDYLEEVALEYAFILDTTDSVCLSDGSSGR